MGKRKRADVYLEVRKKRGNVFFACDDTPKLLRINLHIGFFFHIFIFSELLNLFVMSDNEAFLSALKLFGGNGDRPNVFFSSIFWHFL